MDLSLTLPPLDIPALLRQHGLHPDKRLGQNFLIDNASLLKIIQAAELQPGDLVLEIGAGLGNLTRQLAIRSQRVVAVELDHRLMPALRQVLTPFQNVTIVQGDILSIPAFELLQSFVGNSYQVVANIPYYITSAVIRRLLESTPPPIRICLTVQLEVAERICADPGEDPAECPGERLAPPPCTDRNPALLSKHRSEAARRNPFLIRMEIAGGVLFNLLPIGIFLGPPDL
jgi:16S rRNA (adenine1518-N6/adenine1519-N6)-dimethyltransferase